MGQPHVKPIVLVRMLDLAEDVSKALFQRDIRENKRQYLCREIAQFRPSPHRVQEPVFGWPPVK